MTLHVDPQYFQDSEWWVSDEEGRYQTEISLVEDDGKMKRGGKGRGMMEMVGERVDGSRVKHKSGYSHTGLSFRTLMLIPICANKNTNQ